MPRDHTQQDPKIELGWFLVDYQVWTIGSGDAAIDLAHFWLQLAQPVQRTHRPPVIIERGSAAPTVRGLRLLPSAQPFTAEFVVPIGGLLWELRMEVVRPFDRPPSLSVGTTQDPTKFAASDDFDFQSLEPQIFTPRCTDAGGQSVRSLFNSNGAIDGEAKLFASIVREG